MTNTSVEPWGHGQTEEGWMGRRGTVRGRSLRRGRALDSGKSSFSALLAHLSLQQWRNHACTHKHTHKNTFSWLCLDSLPACGLLDVPLCCHYLIAALVQHYVPKLQTAEWAPVTVSNERKTLKDNNGCHFPKLVKVEQLIHYHFKYEAQAKYQQKYNFIAVTWLLFHVLTAWRWN